MRLLRSGSICEFRFWRHFRGLGTVFMCLRPEILVEWWTHRGFAVHILSKYCVDILPNNVAHQDIILLRSSSLSFSMYSIILCKSTTHTRFQDRWEVRSMRTHKHTHTNSHTNRAHASAGQIECAFVCTLRARAHTHDFSSVWWWRNRLTVVTGERGGVEEGQSKWA